MRSSSEGEAINQDVLEKDRFRSSVAGVRRIWPSLTLHQGLVGGEDVPDGTTEPLQTEDVGEEGVAHERLGVLGDSLALGESCQCL